MSRDEQILPTGDPVQQRLLARSSRFFFFFFFFRLSERLRNLPEVTFNLSEVRFLCPKMVHPYTDFDPSQSGTMALAVSHHKCCWAL